jgi:hypothetical protein
MTYIRTSGPDRVLQDSVVVVKMRVASHRYGSLAEIEESHDWVVEGLRDGEIADRDINVVESDHFHLHGLLLNAYSDDPERLVRRKANARSERWRTPGPIDGEHQSERSDRSQLAEFSSFVKAGVKMRRPTDSTRPPPVGGIML